MKIAPLLSTLVLLTFGASLAAEPSDHGGDFAGTYIATLPERTEIFQLHGDGTAEITLSDQVTPGAAGPTFSDSFGSWKRTGPRRLIARFVNLEFDVDYVLQFAPNLRTFAASCQGKIFPPGEDPLDPSSTPINEFDCAYLDGFLYQRVTTDAAASPREPVEHCVVVLDKLRPGEDSSQVLHRQCSTDADARVLRSNSIVRAATPLMTWYADAIWRGNSTTIYGNYGTCDRSGYGVGNVGEHWNDKISSYNMHGTCYTNDVWEHADFQGASTRFYGHVRWVGDEWNDRISSMWFFSR